MIFANNSIEMLAPTLDPISLFQFFGIDPTLRFKVIVVCLVILSRQNRINIYEDLNFRTTFKPYIYIYIFIFFILSF